MPAVPAEEVKPTDAANAKPHGDDKPDEKPKEPDAKDECSTEDLIKQIGKLTVDLKEARAQMASSMATRDEAINGCKSREKNLLQKIAEYEAQEKEFADKMTGATKAIAEYQAREKDMDDKLRKYKETHGDLPAEEVTS